MTFSIVQKLVLVAIVLVIVLSLISLFSKKRQPVWVGKIIGFVLGFLIARAPGALVGLVCGHIFDMFVQVKRRPSVKKTSAPPRPARTLLIPDFVYLDTLFGVLGHFDAAGCEQKTKDLHRLGFFIQELNLSEDVQKRAWDWYKYGQNKNYHLSQALFGFFQYCRNIPELKQDLWDKLLYSAHEQLPLSASQYAILCEVAPYLGISLETIKNLAPKTQNRRSTRKTPEASERSEYEILGIAPEATPAEVKRAYRKLMSRYHPDRLMSKDLPEELIELATRRTQEIKEAYERICREKGMP